MTLDALLRQAQVRQRRALRDAQLRAHEVDAGDLLGDRVLDLDARVHLEEDVAAVLADAGTPRCRRCGSPRRGRTSPRRRAARARTASSRFGAGAISTTFWWRRCTEQSRSPRCTTSPSAPASTCTSTWRGRSSARSRKTVGSLNAASASRRAVSTALGRSAALRHQAQAAAAAAGRGLHEDRVAQALGLATAPPRGSRPAARPRAPAGRRPTPRRGPAPCPP